MRRHRREWKAGGVAKATEPGCKLTEGTVKMVALVIYDSLAGVKAEEGTC